MFCTLPPALKTRHCARPVLKPTITPPSNFSTVFPQIAEKLANHLFFSNLLKKSEADMQLSINTSLQQTQLDYSQLTFNQSASSTRQQPLAAPRDQVRISDRSRHHDDDHAVRQVRRAHHGEKDNRVADLLKDIIEQITGIKVSNLQKQQQGEAVTAPVTQSSSTDLSVQQSSLSIESKSLSIDGSITTADGAKLSFSLDLQMLHASASASALNASSGPGGYNFNYAGSSLDLTSTSFNFSFTAEMPDDTAGSSDGSGAFSLKDDLKEVRQAMKPLIKEFLKEAGMSSDRRSINQLLQTIA